MVRVCLLRLFLHSNHPGPNLFCCRARQLGCSLHGPPFLPRESRKATCVASLHANEQGRVPTWRESNRLVRECVSAPGVRSSLCLRGSRLVLPLHLLCTMCNPLSAPTECCCNSIGRQH